MGAQPQQLPKEHEGKTEAELNELGFVICPDKPDLNPGQTLSWENNAWVVNEPTEQELILQWQIIKNQAVLMLYDSDYKVLKAYESQTPVDPAWIQYRQDLRDIYNNVNNINPFDTITWPTRPSEEV
jgi:hypothetical protein